MIYLGIVIIALGIALLVAAQVVLRRMMKNYEKSWENQDEMY